MTATSGLFQSDVIPGVSDSYTEFGAPMSWSYSTVLLPDNQNLSNNAVIVTTLAMKFIGGAPTVSVGLYDTNDNAIVTSSFTPAATFSQWDGQPSVSTWDVTAWDGSSSNLAPVWIYWNKPAVFKQASFQASGTSYPGFAIGNLYSEYQVLGYVQQNQSGVG